MSAKTFDRQTAKFLAVVGENMPGLSGDVMQGWIENPKGLQKFLRGFCPPEEVGEPKILAIDRAQPFDPVSFLGEGWSIDEQDERSLALTEVDLAKVRLETMFREGETILKGEERLWRFKEAGHIRLDANVFLALWENQALIPESWKQKTNGNTTYIHFDGTVLRDPRGDRCVLYLYWRVGRWHWGCRWLALDWRVYYPSAVLASV